MCGRFAIAIIAPNLLIEEFNLIRLPFQLEAGYNVAPTQRITAIRQVNGEREAVQMKWGLLPSWAKDESMGAKLCNARGETIAEKPSFRSAFKTRRCLIPASGFYEWQKKSGAKLPHYFTIKDRELFAFAGLWEKWKSPSNEIVESCTIITTEANEMLANFHDRMPVILHKDSYSEWLSEDVRDLSTLRELLRPYPTEEMIYWPVGKAVGSVRNQGPELIARLTEDPQLHFAS